MARLLVLACLPIFILQCQSSKSFKDSLERIIDEIDEISTLFKNDGTDCEDKGWCRNKSQDDCQNVAFVKRLCPNKCATCGICMDFKDWCTKVNVHKCKDNQKLRYICPNTCGECSGDSTTTERPITTSTEEIATSTTTKETSTTSTTEAPSTTQNPPPDASTPVKCLESEGCTCDNGEVSDGFQTYTFKVDGTQRCFTMFTPSTLQGPAPVMISSQCYGKDRLGSLQMTNSGASVNTAAARYGYVRIGISTPDGNWQFGNDNVINDDNPMPCSDNKSKDIVYVRTIMKFIKDQPVLFDSTRVYTEGFSQNSMFSAYIGFCFPEMVRGIWQEGSGMALTGEPPNLPGCQGQCRASDFLLHGKKCKNCIREDPCKECQYWPIYPCYSDNRPMIDCVAEYNNDYISTDRGDSMKSTGRYMYDKLETEGHDGRLLIFAPSDDIPGGHKNPRNTIYWQIGCLGITSACSKQCEASFIECVDQFTKGNSDPEDFDDCISESKFTNLNGCTKDCAPTYSMLKKSETPTEIKGFDVKFEEKTLQTKSADSLCNMSEELD